MSDQSAPSSATSRALRPTLKDFGRSNSFLKEHQQYRAPATATSPTASAVNHPGIDSVVEESAAMSSTISAQTPQSKYAFNGIPVKGQGVISSGIEHSLSHENCVPPASNSSSAAGAPDKLIATLFYHGAPKNGVSSPAAAPAASMAAFPLEPPFPAQDAEQLDHIYGSYVSPLCTAAFLHLMSSFPLPAGVSQLASSHRCLDNQERPRVVEFTLTPAPSPELLSLADLRKHEQIYGFEREWGVEVVLQYESLWRRHPRLVVFDMDATLITQEVIDLLAATIRDPPDLAARVAEITERAMRGELQFDSAFRERVKLLAGLSADIFVQLRPVIDVTKGVPQLVRALKRLGVKTAVLSGGFLPLTGWLAGELGLDYAHANEVVIDPATNTLTGEVLGKIVGPERKRELLIEIAEKEKVDMTQVVACGDGANDLLMLEKAGLLGVAWNAKPKVQMAADARLNSESMLDMLYLFGFTSADIETLIA
ncbi:Phosphoserine phosphatase [Ceratocystis fimbriata CBS 114723]|uniref:phosphoserine phosphatase n=1 Tax=Ceratocystis fimbriata CBS 114723 TaxID=1035309 RepID=A0A2C5X7K3_9PEZI|nr:Phosphoserine phosphatase [Ceratocystis fimbriata CBS 114723]